MRIIDKRQRRHARTRTYNAAFEAQRLVAEAAKAGHEVVKADFVDEVPTTYKYPAVTDGYLAFATPDGTGVIIMVEAPARLCSRAKIARRALGEDAALAFDGRFSSENRQAALQRVTEALRRLAE